MSIKVRCHYDSSLDYEFYIVVEKAAGRASNFGGTDPRSKRYELGWSCKTESEATELRQRLAKRCPEVTVQ